MTARVGAPRSIGAVLDDGVRLWRQSLRPLLLPSVLIGLTGVLPFLAVRVFQGSWTQLARMNPKALLLFEFVALCCWVVRAWWMLGVFNWYHARMRGESIAIGLVLRQAARLLPRRLRLMLVEVFGAFIIGVPFFMGVVSLSAFDRVHAAYYVPIMVVPYCLVALYLYLRLLLSQSLIALEQKNATDAIGDSWELTKGNVWRTTAFVLVLGALYLVLLLCTAVLLATFDAVFGYPVALVQSQASAIMSVFGPWMDAFFSAGVYCLLLDLKARHQGDDLVAKVESLINA